MDEEDDRADEKMAEAPPDPPVPVAAKKKKKKKPKAAYQAPVVKLDENRNKSKVHLLRQIPVYEADVALVIKFLNDHGSITKGELPDLLWVRGSEKQLKTNTQLKLPPGPHGARQLYRVENDGNKLVVPMGKQEAYLRNQMLSRDSIMPMTRDSGYHWLKKNTANISRRILWSFLEKQSVLQITRNIPDERVKGGIVRNARGYCEMDLIHVNKPLLERLGDWLRGQLDDYQMDKGEEDTQKPAYFLTLTEQLTGFSCLGFCPAKTNTAVRRVLRVQIKKMETALKVPIKSISSDHGKEFLGAGVADMLKGKGIGQTAVARASRCEKVNQDFQRGFYRMIRLGRGGFKSCLKQAEKLVNELYNKNIKCTSAEAILKGDAELAKNYKATRQESKPYRGRVPKLGDKWRSATRRTGRALQRAPVRGPEHHRTYQGGAAGAVLRQQGMAGPGRDHVGDRSRRGDRPGRRRAE